jgi:hypothetical protein
MFTLSEMGGAALITALAAAALTAWLVWNLTASHYLKIIHEHTLQAPVDPTELVTVTLHDAISDEFIETKRFGSDIYAALVYIDGYKSMYNLTLKVRRTNGEYVSLTLINS